jgi:hypothetical protein
MLRYDPGVTSPYSDKLKKKVFAGSIDDNTPDAIKTLSFAT